MGTMGYTAHLVYNLGDKVVFPERGIDSNCNIPEANSSNNRPKIVAAVSYSVITIPLPLHYSVHYVCYCTNIYSVITVSVYSVGRIIHQHLRLVIHN